MTTAIILAAGKSERMGANVDKGFLSLVDKPVLAWSLLAFERCPAINLIVLVVRKDKLLAAKELCKRYGISKLDKIVAGGTRRADSVQEGLKACDLDTREVVIHDGARPLVTSELVTDVVKLVKRMPAVTVARPITDTLKRSEKQMVAETVPRDHLWAVQTPQAFQMSVLRAAYKALPPKTDVTDDCSVVEKTGTPVRLFEYLKPNVKITTVEDLHLAMSLMRG